MKYAQIPEAVLGDRDLTPGAVRLYGLLDFAAGKKGWCDPSEITLAEHMGVSDRSIRNYIASLSAKGYILITRRIKDTKEPDTNLYLLPHRMNKLSEGQLADIQGQTSRKPVSGRGTGKKCANLRKPVSYKQESSKEDSEGANAPASGPSLAPATIKALRERYDEPTDSRITCLVGESAPIAALQINGGTFSDLTDQTQRKVEAYVASGESGVVVLSTIKAHDEATAINGFVEAARFIDVTKLKAAA